MEDRQLLNISGLAQPDPLLPCGMASSDKIRELGVGVSAVVNHQIRALDQTQNGIVGFIGPMFCIRYVTN